MEFYRGTCPSVFMKEDIERSFLQADMGSADVSYIHEGYIYTRLSGELVRVQIQNGYIDWTSDWETIEDESHPAAIALSIEQ